MQVEVQEEGKVAEEEDDVADQGSQGIQEFFQQTHGDRNNQSFVIGASRNSKSYRLSNFNSSPYESSNNV